MEASQIIARLCLEIKFLKDFVQCGCPGAPDSHSGDCVITDALDALDLAREFLGLTGHRKIGG